MFCLVANQLLRLLIFLVYLIVGVCQLLQLLGTHHRENLAPDNAAAVHFQRCNDQVPDCHTGKQHQEHQQRNAHFKFGVDVPKHCLRVVLVVAGLLPQQLRGAGNVIILVCAQNFVFVAVKDLLRALPLVVEIQRLVLRRQLNLPNLVRPQGFVGKADLNHQAHNIIILLSQTRLILYGCLQRAYGGRAAEFRF